MTLPTTPPRPRSGINFSAILQAENWDQLRESTQRLLHALALDHFMLKTDITFPNGTFQCRLFGSLPTGVLNMFHTNEQSDDDPVNHHFLQSILPLTWQIVPWCAMKGAGHTYSLLKAHGVRHGISVPVRGDFVASRVDFYGNVPETFPLSSGRYADLHLLALYLHEAAHLLRYREALGEVPLLSEREIECLRWCARGKTSEETALIVGISHHTVNHHIKSVQTKLNVYSMRQAINRAATMNLI